MDTTTFTLPSAETLLGYEKLGIVGILLLVLCALLVVGFMFLRWGRSFGDDALEQLGKQTIALQSLRDSNDRMEHNQTRLHERLDRTLSCPLNQCPLRPAVHVPDDQRYLPT